MKDEFESAGSIAVIKPCCGGVILIAVNAPRVVDAKMKKEIGELVSKGCRVEHWTREQTKTKDWKMGCQCSKELFSTPTKL